MKQPDFLFAVLLPHSLPQEVLALLDGYLRSDCPGIVYLACSEVAVQSPFVHLAALRNDDSGKVWKIRLPTQYALAIVEWSDEEALSIGFLKSKS
jgi:hypothetical protein